MFNSSSFGVGVGCWETVVCRESRRNYFHLPNPGILRGCSLTHTKRKLIVVAEMGEVRCKAAIGWFLTGNISFPIFVHSAKQAFMHSIAQNEQESVDGTDAKLKNTIFLSLLYLPVLCIHN